MQLCPRLKHGAGVFLRYPMAKTKAKFSGQRHYGPRLKPLPRQHIDHKRAKFTLVCGGVVAGVCRNVLDASAIAARMFAPNIGVKIKPAPHTYVRCNVECPSCDPGEYCSECRGTRFLCDYCFGSIREHQDCPICSRVTRERRMSRSYYSNSWTFDSEVLNENLKV